MIIECPKCNRKYEVEDSYIPVGGAPIKCPNCGNIFGIYVEPIDIPMTPVFDDQTKTPANDIVDNGREFGSASISPTPEPVVEKKINVSNNNIEDYGNIAPANTINDLQNPFTTTPETPKEEAKPEIPNPFATTTEPPKEEAKPEIPNPFATTTEPPKEEAKPEIPNPFATTTEPPKKEAKPEIPNPFATTTEPPKKEAKPEIPNPFATTTEPPKEEVKPETTAPKKIGAKIFESLLAGFTLPENFKSLPPNIQKNHKNAIKLARQLARDILLYHKATVEEGRKNNNLKDILHDEIEKSLKFYQQRIQPEILQTTNYFNEALNKILANGENIF